MSVSISFSKTGKITVSGGKGKTKAFKLKSKDIHATATVISKIVWRYIVNGSTDIVIVKE